MAYGKERLIRFGNNIRDGLAIKNHKILDQREKLCPPTSFQIVDMMTVVTLKLECSVQFQLAVGRPPLQL